MVLFRDMAQAKTACSRRKSRGWQQEDVRSMWTHHPERSIRPASGRGKVSRCPHWQTVLVRDVLAVSSPQWHSPKVLTLLLLLPPAIACVPGTGSGTKGGVPSLGPHCSSQTEIFILHLEPKYSDLSELTSSIELVLMMHIFHCQSC